MGKKKAVKKGKPLQPKAAQKQIADEEEKPFDFGGIPSRDLKKNLGCG